jgi:DNA polymerase-1
MSHIYRAYFAPMGARQDPLRNSKGQITQAIFVFTNMLRKLIKDEKPDYIAAIFESEVGTFRHDAYAEYKANRQEMPEELVGQIPYIIRLCGAFNIPILQADKYEADDVIGTLANKVAEKGLRAVSFPTTKTFVSL